MIVIEYLKMKTIKDHLGESDCHHAVTRKSFVCVIYNFGKSYIRLPTGVNVVLD